MIAANADPESGVTIEKLMTAQGIIEGTSIPQRARVFEENCRRIIADELLSRGYSVSYPDAGKQRQSYSYFYDFLIKTDAIDHGDGRWISWSCGDQTFSPM